MSEKMKPHHLERKAILYVRPSSAYQVSNHLESQKLPYAMQARSRQWGWRMVTAGRVCCVVDTLLIDQEMVYTPRLSNGRFLLGLKRSLNEYELDLLRQRSVEARREKACRRDLIVSAPIGYIKTEDQRLEKDPDCRVQEAVLLVFAKFLELGTARQVLLWFLEHGLQLPVVDRRREVHWIRPSYGTMHQILSNPVYGGAYAYGKTERVGVDTGCS